MSATTDALHAKTDDELRFFVANPQFYQPELVDTARRELRRRGALSAAEPAPVVQYAPDYPAPTPPGPQAPGRARWPGWPAVLVLLLAGGGFWLYAHRTSLATPSRPPQGPAANNLAPEALKLETVATYTLPAFDVPQLVQEQLASVPAAQKHDEQVLRQFRALSKRFWAAETQSEYLTNAAYTHAAAPTFADQARQVRETWQEWNRAAVYTFKFGPEMSRQLELMRQVGSSQQHRLERIPRLLAKNQFLADRELTARRTDVEAWMSGLRRTSPVTGKVYENKPIEMHL